MTHRADRRRGARVALLCALALAGCSEPDPRNDPRLLVLDGIEIRFDELEPYVAFLDSFRPEGGRKTKVMLALTEHVLPLRLARRAFPAEREEQRRRAEALAAVADNVAELERQSALVEHKRRSALTRMKALLPVAMFLFDPLTRGAVSPPIEVPQGWFVVGAFDYQESPIALADHVDALQVGFVTHTSRQWTEWIEAEQQRIGAKATFVHPDYREMMPAWIEPPRNP